ncbi:hypothetical protein AURDEDRAFT_165615 [Auricularia subglabra TFB-10046 SS5]|nr:hypothetical protein AURDEDRAFT_165615 [Auricularia subglabra TFB-10046 SS5]
MSPAVDAAAGKNGKVSISYQNGTRISTEFVVSQAAAFPDQSAGLIASPLAMPQLSDSLDALPLSVSINNTILAKATADADGSALAKTDVSASPGQSCTLALTTTTCTATGTTRIRVTAQGFMWFYYQSMRDGHIRWNVDIDGTADTDIEDRSTYIHLNVSITSSKITAVTPQCLDSDTATNSQQTAEAGGAAHKPGISAYKVFLPVVIVILLLGATAGFLLGKWRRQTRGAPAAEGSGGSQMDASGYTTETDFTSSQGSQPGRSALAGDPHAPGSTRSDEAADPPPAYSTQGVRAPAAPRRRK